MIQKKNNNNNNNNNNKSKIYLSFKLKKKLWSLKEDDLKELILWCFSENFHLFEQIVKKQKSI
jgi:hypothetical protein